MKRRFAPLVSTAVAGLLATTLSTMSPIAAQAHDEVLGTTPAAGATVPAGVIDLSVSFNEDIMATPDNSGEAIELIGPDGLNDYLLGGNCLSVSGSTVSTKADIDQAGKYTVMWRSVSNDGHPSEGQFDFTVTNDNGYKGSGLLSAISGPCTVGVADHADLPSAQPTETDTATWVSAPVIMPRTTSNKDNALAVGYGFAGLAAAMLLGFAALVRGSRRR